MIKFKFLILFSLMLSATLFSQTKTASKNTAEKEKVSAKSFKGKLMIEFYGQTAPLVNASVVLVKDGKVDSTTITRTDKYGDFEVTPKNNSSGYGLNVKPETNEVTNIILATQRGVEITRLKRGPNGFEYKLIPADVIKLTEMEVNEDITLTVDKFKNSSKTDLQVIEDINYKSDEYKIDKAAQVTIDKIAKIMKENPGLKLEIVSHTDSRGDDKMNTTLSQKRSQAVADYLIANMIEKDRLSFSGKGESALRNRCKNGVDCSEKEHSYNRRTEFNFRK